MKREAGSGSQVAVIDPRPSAVDSRKLVQTRPRRSRSRHRRLWGQTEAPAMSRRVMANRRHRVLLAGRDRP
jgi:hypothetical protein